MWNLRNIVVATFVATAALLIAGGPSLFGLLDFEQSTTAVPSTSDVIVIDVIDNEQHELPPLIIMPEYPFAGYEDRMFSVEIPEGSSLWEQVALKIEADTDNVLTDARREKLVADIVGLFQLQNSDDLNTVAENWVDTIIVDPGYIEYQRSVESGVHFCSANEINPWYEKCSSTSPAEQPVLDDATRAILRELAPVGAPGVESQENGTMPNSAGGDFGGGSSSSTESSDIPPFVGPMPMPQLESLDPGLSSGDELKPLKPFN